MMQQYSFFSTSKMRYFFDESDQAYIAEQGFIKSTQFKEQIFVFVFKLLLSGESFAEHAHSSPVKPFFSLVPAHIVTPTTSNDKSFTISLAPNVFLVFSVLTVMLQLRIVTAGVPSTCVCVTRLNLTMI